jgi:hypothetical protein
MPRGQRISDLMVAMPRFQRVTKACVPRNQSATECCTLHPQCVSRSPPWATTRTARSPYLARAVDDCWAMAALLLRHSRCAYHDARHAHCGCEGHIESSESFDLKPVHQLSPQLTTSLAPRAVPATWSFKVNFNGNLEHGHWRIKPVATASGSRPPRAFAPIGSESSARCSGS